MLPLQLAKLHKQHMSDTACFCPAKKLTQCCWHDIAAARHMELKVHCHASMSQVLHSVKGSLDMKCTAISQMQRNARRENMRGGRGWRKEGHLQCKARCKAAEPP